MATLQQLQSAFVKADSMGEEKDAQSFADSIRAHPTFQQNAKENLDRGDYKYADDGFSETGKDEQRANMSKQVARSMGLKDSDVDVTQGMGTYGRFKLSFQPTQQDKVKHLEDTYGRENIRAVDIGGKMKLLYRDEQETGNQFRAVDEEGTSLADFFGDTAGEVLPIAGAIAGGVAGLAGGIPGSVAGAAAGGALARGAQDITTRAISGEEQQYGEMGGRILKEAAVGAVADVLTLGAGRFIGKPLMKSLGKTPAAQGIVDSMQSLKGKYGINLEETASMTKGVKAREKASVRAGETGGGLTNTFQSNIDEIGRASRVVDGVEAPTTAASAIKRMQTRVKDAYDTDIAESARLGGEITEAYKTRATQTQQALQYQLDNEISGLRIPREFDPEVSAGNFRDSMLTQKGLVSDASRSKFEQGLGNMESFSIPASRLEAKLGNTVDVLKGVETDDALISGLSSSKVTQLGKSVSKLQDMAEAGEVIPFRSLHNLKKSLDDASGYGSAQPGDNQLVARRAASKVRGLIDDSLASAGNKGKAYKDANKFFQERITPFRTKAIAPILASDAAPGTFKETGEKLARKVVSDPEYVRQILKNAGGAKGAVRKEMSKMYLDSMGTTFELNERIAVQLLPSDVVRSLKRIKSLKDKLKVPARKISEGDVRAMVNGMTGDARAEAEKALNKKLRADARASKIIQSNKLISKISSGKQPMPSNPREFADDVMKENSETIKNFVERLSDDPEALAGLRAGVTENFRDAIKFGGDGAQRTSMKAGETALWKAGDVEKILKGPKGERYRSALGDDWVKDWIDLDRALKGSEITGTPIKEQVRAVFTTGTGLLIVAAGVPKWAYGRALNALGGSKIMRPFLRNVEQNPEAMKQLIPYLLSTSRGIEALLEEGKNDPEFAEFLDQQLSQEEE